MFEPNGIEPLVHVAIRPGDLVASARGPQEALFSVVLVCDDRCWVRDLQTGLDAILNVHACRRIGGQAGHRSA
jgi:hypothetical protein